MISLILCLLAGIAKAFQDIIAHEKPAIFKYVSMKDSWRNKWKNGDPKQGEKFWGSSRFFVFYTDHWHLAQFFFLNLMIAAIVFYKPMVNPLVDFIILAVVLKGTFELFYSRILVKK